MKIKIIDFGYDNLPFRAHANDAGADVFIPNKFTKMIIHPNEVKTIPLGFGLELPDGYAGFIFPRTGWSSKGITCELPPIDSGYKGEINAIVTNGSSSLILLEPGQRIGQLVILPIVIADFITEDIQERGTNAFGSTGK